MNITERRKLIGELVDAFKNEDKKEQETNENN